MKITLEKIVIVLFLLAIGYQLFVPPVVGVADNGDFARVIDKVGIGLGENKEYYEYINLKLPIAFSYNIKGYQSSELLFVLTAIGLNGILFRDGYFYLQVLGLLHAIALAGSVAVLVFAMSGLLGRSRWAVYACILLFFTDVGYVGFLNSLYSEPASFIFLALTNAAFLFVLWRAERGLVAWYGVLGFFIASFLFVIAKPQNAALGLPLAVLGYRLFTLMPQSPAIASKAKKWLGAALAVGLLGASFLFFAFGLPRYYRSGDLWNSIFLEILGNSQTPERDLAELGLPAEMLAFKGTNAFSEGVNRSAYPEFQNSWLYFRIFRFYLMHPQRLLQLMKQVMPQVFELQQSNLGNFTRDSGAEPLAKSQKFAFWHDWRQWLLPKSAWGLIAFFVLNGICAGIKWLRFDQTVTARLLSELHLAIACMAVLQYFTVLMAEGTYELVKHMFLFNLLVDVNLVFLVAYIFGLAAMFFSKMFPHTS